MPNLSCPVLMPIEPRKSRSTLGSKSGHWSEKEKLKYVIFLEYHTSKFEIKEMRRYFRYIIQHALIFFLNTSIFYAIELGKYSKLCQYLLRRDQLINVVHIIKKWKNITLITKKSSGLIRCLSTQISMWPLTRSMLPVS